ncbi:MAG: NosD domain-containing protein [Promethearchaeota archaeon]
MNNWNVNSIEIIGNNGWSDLATSQPWCSGSGLWTDPYIIENITIDGNHELWECIVIKDSNVPFIIKNSIIVNSSCCYPYWCYCGIRKGIELINVYNGQISNNQIIYHDYGIIMKNSDNNTIKGNIIKNNNYGISLETNSCNNSIENNYLKNSYGQTKRGVRVGIRITNSFNNSIKENLIYNTGVEVNPQETNFYNSNLVNDKNLYIYYHQNNLSNENFINAGQIILKNCSNSNINGINISYTCDGIILEDCFNITLKSSTFALNWFTGISLNNCNKINISECYLPGNDLELKNSTQNKINFNILRVSSILLDDSHNNNIEFNLLNYTPNGIRLNGNYNRVINNTIWTYHNCITDIGIGNIIENNTCIKLKYPSTPNNPQNVLVGYPILVIMVISWGMIAIFILKMMKKRFKRLT